MVGHDFDEEGICRKCAQYIHDRTTDPEKCDGDVWPE